MGPCCQPEERGVLPVSGPSESGEGARGRGELGRSRPGSGWGFGPREGESVGGGKLGAGLAGPDSREVTSPFFIFLFYFQKLFKSDFESI